MSVLLMFSSLITFFPVPSSFLRCRTYVFTHIAECLACALRRLFFLPPNLLFICLCPLRCSLFYDNIYRCTTK
ncbi:hypothetical protein BD414DRAFT_475842 [Trametes punicea]|nr:hypothetical protein BD414DRAFT_475842 [Trametes punicea]